MRKNRLEKLVAFVGVVALGGCLGSAPKGKTSGAPGSGGATGSGATGSSGGTNSGGTTGGGSTTGGTAGGGTTSGGTTSGGVDAGATTPAPDPNLAARAIDYGAALRTAAIKLVGNLPTVAEMNSVTDATSYAAQLDKYLADPRFARQVKIYFSDMMKMGGMIAVQTGNGTVNVSLDTAPTFAAEVVVNDRPITDILTATTNTCPTLDTTKGTFTDAACATANGSVTAGVLTDPGAMAQFYSNMAFRRVRWVQETFDCLKFPAEFGATPAKMGNGLYTSPWPFSSVSGGTSALVNFQDTSSVVCANCHTTMNHIAPLFANFDMTGSYQTSIQVHTPVLKTPLSQLSDWLPSGETLSWRFGTKVASLTDLGTAMAADAAVQKCQVQRAWNWMMNKTDIVNDLAIVPDSTINDVMSVFTSSGMKLKETLKAILTSSDFVSF
jgi:hypothetical protein